MKNTLNVIALCAAAVMLTAFSFSYTKWNIEPDYTIKFEGRMAEGTFSDLEGKIIYDPTDLKQAVIDVAVDASTIKTGNETKDKHARGDSWFDVEAYPLIKFKSTSFTKADEGLLVNGLLTMHGVTKEVRFPYNYEQNGDRAIFTGMFTVNRKDFGIEGNVMGFMVSDEIEVALRIPVSGK